MLDIDFDGPNPPKFNEARHAKFRIHSSFSPIRSKDYVVDGFLARRESSCFFGEPGATKSTLALDIACHVASGLPWMGKGAGEYAPACGNYPEQWMQGEVLYIALERADQVQRRVEAFALEHELKEPMSLAIYDGELDLVNDDSDRITQILLDLEGQTSDSRCPFEFVNLIVIDTLSRTLGSGSDSGGEETAKFARHIRRTLEFSGAHILVVHHTPIGDDSRLRGHGNLHAAFDQTVRVQKFKGGSLATVIKDNDTPEDEKPAFAYNVKSVVIDTDEVTGRTTTASVVVPALQSDVRPVPRKASKPVNDNIPSASKSEAPVLDALVSLGGRATESDWRVAFDQFRAEDISSSAHRKRFSVGKPNLERKGLVTKNLDETWAVTALPQVLP